VKAQNPSDTEDQGPGGKPVYDLAERTARFGEAVILLAHKLPRSEVVRPLVNELVRSSTSIGANYMEADGAESRRDFAHKVAICKKEAKETTHWLRMLVAGCPDFAGECRSLSREANELALIFSAIVRKVDSQLGRQR